jgi:hypothetical protein
LGRGRREAEGSSEQEGGRREEGAGMHLDESTYTRKQAHGEHGGERTGQAAMHLDDTHIHTQTGARRAVASPGTIPSWTFHTLRTWPSGETPVEAEV